MSLFRYKGYLGRVALDTEANLLHGEVLGLRDVITFQGKSVEEVRQAFQDSVDDYLRYCSERGEEPEGRGRVDCFCGSIGTCTGPLQPPRSPRASA